MNGKLTFMSYTLAAMAGICLSAVLPCCLEEKAEDGWDGELHFSFDYILDTKRKRHIIGGILERVIAFRRVGPHGDDHKKQR